MNTEDNMETYVILQIRPLSKSYNGIIKKQGETVSTFPISHLLTLGFDQISIDKVVTDFIDDDQSTRDGCFEYRISRNTSTGLVSQNTKQIQRIIKINSFFIEYKNQEVIENHYPNKTLKNTLRKVTVFYLLFKFIFFYQF